MICLTDDQVKRLHARLVQHILSVLRRKIVLPVTKVPKTKISKALKKTKSRKQFKILKLNMCLESVNKDNGLKSVDKTSGWRVNT